MINDGLTPLGSATEWSAEAIAAKVRESSGDFVPARRLTGNKPNRDHQRRVLEAARLTADAITGRLDPFLFRQAWQPTNEIYLEALANEYPLLFKRQQVGLRETVSTSDYSALTVDVLDRMLYGYYTAAPITNMPLVKTHTLRDFRLVARYAMDGAVKPFSRMPNDFPSLTPHGTGEPPTQRAMQQSALEVEGSTQRVTYQPQLYQGSMSVNWRALVNDDLGIFQDMVQRLAISGRRTIYSFITALYVQASGWNTTIANGSAFSNLVTTAYGASSNNPALSWQGLLDGRVVLEKMTDIDGQPIDFAGTLYLYVGPALAPTAMSMAKAIQADISVGGGTTNAQGFPSQRLRVDNWPMAGVVPIVDKYIPFICTQSGTKDTMWALIYDPPAQARPAVELGQLQGFETPQLFQKIPNTMRVGGGTDPMLGDFWTMNTDYKGVLVLGGTQIDGRSAVFSTGQGV